MELGVYKPGSTSAADTFVSKVFTDDKWVMMWCARIKDSGSDPPVPIENVVAALNKFGWRCDKAKLEKKLGKKAWK